MSEYHDLIYIISILFLLAISALFSGSETGFTASSEGKIHRLAKDGNKRAKIVEKLLAKRDKLMATILIGNNIVNILASALATSLAIEYFGGGSGVFLATAIMTILIVIFSEITPKTYALKKSEKLALFLSPFLLFFSRILSPLTFFSTKFTGFLYDKDDKTPNPSSHLEEIRGVVELKHSQGAFLKSEKDMINGVLDLKEVEISQILTHRKNIKSINIKQDLKLIIKQAFEINHSKIPLWKKNEDNIIAILDMRQLIRDINRYSGDLSKIKINNITTQPLFIPPQNRIGHQLVEFRQKKETIAIVVDEYGTIDGIVTLFDIVEEIIGEFNESESKNNITKLPNNYFKINGKVPIRDVNRELNWNLKEDDDNSSTIAGFVIANIGKIPEQNEEFKFDGFQFKILKKQNNQIKTLSIKKLQESNYQDD
ncbi:CNNM domain-containing protein [Rickettsiales bacterium]|nr:CNNM domain-containing protein [Rickettsiales bacterium]